MDRKVAPKKTKLKILRGKRKSKDHTPDIQPDYFARFRFDRNDLIYFLKACSGMPYAQEPLVYQCLDDLGYWHLVRSNEIFEFTPELEKSIHHQFDFLESKFDYLPGDVLLWASLGDESQQRFLVRVIEKIAEGDDELFRVEILEGGATFIVSRFELDYWNATGGSLPEDALVETISWNDDTIWLKRLGDFKEYMTAKNFRFNFGVSPDEIAAQQKYLLSELETFFGLSEGPLRQSNLGIGFLACGQGDQHDNALVCAFVLQALGQCFGISARLWGNETTAGKHPNLLVITLGRKSSDWTPWLHALQNPEAKPMQRPLSEVLRLLLCRGPFGKPEADHPVKSFSKSQDLGLIESHHLHT
jgi:hypothetical protein